MAGLIERAQVEPLSLPSEFTQITNQREVSIALPGPIIASHQPSDGSSALDAACALGERPVRMSTALSRALFNSPQVSYATLASRNSPPRFIAKGEGREQYRRASWLMGEPCRC